MSCGRPTRNPPCKCRTRFCVKCAWYHCCDDDWLKSSGVRSEAIASTGACECVDLWCVLVGLVCLVVSMGVCQREEARGARGGMRRRRGVLSGMSRVVHMLFCEADFRTRCTTHPGRWTRAALRRQLAIVGGDGAISAGGPEARRASTGAAEKLWTEVMTPDGGDPLAAGVSAAATPCVEWDLFHRVDAAVTNAARSHPAVEEVLSVARTLGALFGTGEGRALYRNSQEALGLARRVVPDQGGTRKLVAITASIEYVADNLAAVHGAMHARLGGARGAAGSQSQGSLVSFGRRVSALNFVTFALAVCDVMPTSFRWRSSPRRATLGRWRFGGGHRRRWAASGWRWNICGRSRTGGRSRAS